MRHIRAMCRDDLAEHGESEAVNAIVADLSRRLFPEKSPRSIEEIAEQLTAAIFGRKSS